MSVRVFCVRENGESLKENQEKLRESFKGWKLILCLLSTTINCSRNKKLIKK